MEDSTYRDIALDGLATIVQGPDRDLALKASSVLLGHADDRVRLAALELVSHCARAGVMSSSGIAEHVHRLRLALLEEGEDG